MTLAQPFFTLGPSGSQEEPFKIKFPLRDFSEGVKHTVEAAQVLPTATLLPVPSVCHHIRWPHTK